MLENNSIYFILHCARQLSIKHINHETEHSSASFSAELKKALQIFIHKFMTSCLRQPKVASDELRKAPSMFPRKIPEPINYQNWKLQVGNQKKELERPSLLETTEPERKRPWRHAQWSFKVMIITDRSINGICCKKICSGSKLKTLTKVTGKMRQELKKVKSSWR